MHTGLPVDVRGLRLSPGEGRWIACLDEMRKVTPDGLDSSLRCSRFMGIGPLEHYSAAMLLSACGDWILQASRGDLPLLDGSAVFLGKPFQDLKAVPVEGFEACSWLRTNGGFLHARPSGEFQVRSETTLPDGSSETWSGGVKELADCMKARTFIAVDEFAKARASGLLAGCGEGQGRLLGPASSEAGRRLAESRGLDPDATILVGARERMDGECAAHKVLDLVGDLGLFIGALPGLEIHMKDVGHREFHALGSMLHQRRNLSKDPGGS
jgi:hypothetical protein